MKIQDIYAAQPVTIKNKILADLQMKGVSYSAAYAWCTGARPPKPIARPAVVKVINAATGGTYQEKELWPDEMEK